jgi:hypothetical protein
MGRGNKIDVPIRDGQPAKMYLLAYPKRIKAYTLAERLFGRDPPPKKYSNIRKGRVRQPNKIYNYLKKYPELFDKNDQGIISRVEPLADRIEKDLQDKNEILDIAEKDGLRKLLDSSEFRNRKLINPKEGLKQNPLEYFYLILGLGAFNASWVLETTKAVPRRKRLKKLETLNPHIRAFIELLPEPLFAKLMRLLPPIIFNFLNAQVGILHIENMIYLKHLSRREKRRAIAEIKEKTGKISNSLF